MSQINLELGKHEEAISFGYKALFLSKGLDSKFKIAGSYFTLGSSYYHKGESRKALEYLSHSEIIFKELEVKIDLIDVYEYYSLVYSRNKDYKRALKYKTLQAELKDTIKNEANIKISQEMEAKYQVQQKEDSIKIQQSQLIIAQKENEIQVKQLRFRSLITIGIVLITCILAIFLFVFRKKNSLITFTNKQLEFEKIRAETFLKEVQHRVKNNLQFAASILDLHSKGIDDKDIKAAVSDGRNRIEAMGILHQKLLYHDQNPTSIQMQNYLTDLVQNLSLAHDPRSKIKLSLQVDPIKLDVEKAMRIGLIINELVTNAYKYLPPNTKDPKINIALKDDQGLQLLIQDNGGGIPVNFELKKEQSFGLQLVALLARQLNGKLNIENTPGACYELNFSELIQKKL